MLNQDNMIFMKKLLIYVFMTSLATVGLSAQDLQTVQDMNEKEEFKKFRMASDYCYEHFFLDDADGALKENWALALTAGVDYYLHENVYWGASIGYAFGIVKYDFGHYTRTWSDCYDIRLPLRVGISCLDGFLKLDTGPFVDFTVEGETTYYRGINDKTTIKLKDMDVNTVSLGWSISLKLCKLIKVGYSFKLSDSFYGEGGDVGFLSVGLDYGF